MVFDPLAQLVEHNTFNVGVMGSSPMRITKDGFRGILIKYPSFRLYTCTCVPIRWFRGINTIV